MVGGLKFENKPLSLFHAQFRLNFVVTVEKINFIKIKMSQESTVSQPTTVCEKIQFSQKEVNEMRSILCMYLFNFLSDNRLIDEFICDIEKQNEDPDFLLKKEGKLKELIVKLFLGRKNIFL